MEVWFARRMESPVAERRLDPSADARSPARVRGGIDFESDPH
jgi:hypothetical protein